MQLSLLTAAGHAEVWLDGLCTESILLHLGAEDLASVCLVCRDMLMPAQAAAHQSMLLLLQRLNVTVQRQCERGSWIVQLRGWERVEISLKLWHKAEETELGTDADGQEHVQAVADLSGHGHHAVSVSSAPPPILTQSAINGLPALKFDGSHVLKAGPFAKPLKQPITLMTVARARGDVTIVDSFGPRSDRFELCHGYPSGWHAAPQIFMTASGRDQAPKSSLRGASRSEGKWRLYTAIFDRSDSELYLDGKCEASGKDIGSNSLDGLSIGCDHSGVFFLNGSLAEIRIFQGRMPALQRAQVEASLARRYGLSYQCELPAGPRKSSARLSRRASSRSDCSTS